MKASFVVDRHRFDVDPDLTFHFLIPIQIRNRIRMLPQVLHMLKNHNFFPVLRIRFCFLVFIGCESTTVIVLLYGGALPIIGHQRVPQGAGPRFELGAYPGMLASPHLFLLYFFVLGRSLLQPASQRAGSLRLLQTRPGLCPGTHRIILIPPLTLLFFFYHQMLCSEEDNFIFYHT